MRELRVEPINRVKIDIGTLPSGEASRSVRSAVEARCANAS